MDKKWLENVKNQQLSDQNQNENKEKLILFGVVKLRKRVQLFYWVL